MPLSNEIHGERLCGREMMKILIIGDKIHPFLYDYFDKKHFPGVELILSTGDLESYYLSFLVTMFNKPLYYVRGNHDTSYSENPPEGCRNIDGQLITYKGLRIMGLEGSMWYGGRGVEYTERQMRWKIAKLRYKISRKKGVDIILTHAPPKGIHDGRDQCHQGFQCFRDLIDRYKPQYFIHGHTHLNYNLDDERVSLVGKTEVINSYGYHILEMKNPLASKIKLTNGEK